MPPNANATSRPEPWPRAWRESWRGRPRRQPLPLLPLPSSSSFSSSSPACTPELWPDRRGCRPLASDRPPKTGDAFVAGEHVSGRIIPARTRKLLSMVMVIRLHFSANTENCEFFHKDRRPPGADQRQSSGNSYWLAALPPCTTKVKDLNLFTKISDQRERTNVNRAEARIGWRPCRPVLLRSKIVNSIHKDQRPTGADQRQSSGSSYWLAALPPCG